MTANGTASVDAPEILAVTRGMLWAMPALVPFGTLANVFNLIVFTRPQMKHLSTSVYLSALSVSDIIMLYFYSVRAWIEETHVIDKHSYMSTAYCQTMDILSYTSRVFSNWMIVAITFERFVVMAFPFKATSFCTVKKAKILTIVIFSFSGVSQSVSLYGSRLKYHPNGDPVCFIATTGVMVLVRVFVSLFSEIIPIVSVLLLNIIVVALMCCPRNRPIQSSRDDADRMEQMRKLTTMLISIAIFFLICEIPWLVALLWYIFSGYSPQLSVLISVSKLLGTIDHSCNFIFYVLCGRKFRDVFLGTIACGARKRKDGVHNESDGKISTSQRPIYQSESQSTVVSTIA